MSLLAKPNDLVPCPVCNGTRVSRHSGQKCIACKTGYITRERRSTLQRIADDLTTHFLSLDEESLRILGLTDTELAS